MPIWPEDRVDTPSTDLHEEARLNALAKYALLEGGASEALDRIARLVAQLLQVHAASITLISRDWQHVKACFNWISDDTPREATFCTHTIALGPAENVLEVTDARQDALFRTNPLVVGPPFIRYYAGVPLRTPEGYAVGSLCLLDTRPRAPLGAAQRALLSEFAAIVLGEFDRHRALRELRAAYETQRAHEARLAAFMRHTSDAVAIKDRDGRYLEVNPATARLVGPATDMLGRTDEELFGAREYAVARETDERVLRTGEALRTERRMVLNGEERIFHTTKFPLILEDGEVHGVIAVGRDMTEREALTRELREANAQLERRVAERTRALENAVYRDALTGLSNRRAFDLALDAALSRAASGGGNVQLVLFDLDELKGVNDRFGHGRGDELLRAFASALRVFEGGAAFRLGGDEFAVLLEDVLPEAVLPKDAAETAPPDAPNALQAWAREAVQLTRAAGFPLLHASVGSARYPSDARFSNELLRLADQRMLRDKATRKAEHKLAAFNAPSAEHSPDLAVQAIRATLSLLTRDGELDGAAWKTLLEAAVASVPGADGGSLTIREGATFVLRAQVGFSDALLGLEQTSREAEAWYGQGHWAAGRARLIRGEAVNQHSRAVHAAAGNERNRLAYERHGDVERLCANVCVPVVLGGEVIAQLNLDNLRLKSAFDEDALRVAEEFAAQAAALLAAARRRASEAARRRELEALVRVNSALREVQSAGAIQAVLVRETASLLDAEQVVFLQYEPQGYAQGYEKKEYESQDGVLRATAVHGSPAPPALAFRRGEGAVWTALEERRSVQWGVGPGSEWSELLGAGGASVLVAPLWTADAWIGALVVARPVQASFGDAEVQLLEAVASAGVTALKRVRAEQDSAEHVQELRLLADLSSLAGAFDDPSLVAERCLAACRSFLGADYASYHHVERQVTVSDGLAPAALARALSEFLAQKARVHDLLFNSPPVLATPAYPEVPGAFPALAQAGMQGVVLVPVSERGARVGFVTLVWFGSRAALPGAAGSLSARVAELIGRALERRAHIEDLEGAREGALLALGLSLELRDFETHGHTERVVALSAALGSALGLTAQELEGLRQGAYLHDVGKLAVPDAVLLKPGKLDPDEWRVMQSHAAVGADMMARLTTLHPHAREVIRHHHERWDGRGYPAALTDDQIPRAARIFSVVDVFDALISARPYKPAWSREAALAEIAGQAGAQFDPDVVRAFLELVRREEFVA